MRDTTIFTNKIVLEVNQSEAEKLIRLLEDYLESCEDIITMKVYVPTLEKLEEQLEKQKL